ncbi:MAG: EscU/YscU/HrcU family type III secretion system export apparatus switch protein, partial [Candidatus Eremiobacteraeota bacterium]|nr:EscU/YscU/HrcU family type III secretion system export apparatus switch protein [Candidatus Eremiobacteraeota bacterium]
MSEGGEKRFDATPSRIAKAKREGNSARSQEFGSTIAFAAASFAAFAIAGPIGGAASRAILLSSRGHAATAQVAEIFGFALMPAVAAAMGGAIAAIVQSGGLTVVAVVPKFERLNPAESFKRMCSRETVTHGLRAATAFAAASVAIGPLIRGLFGTVATAATPQHVAAVAWAGSERVVFTAASVGGLFAFAEYGFARRSWLQKLRMSFDELKREVKENDGDPTARGRRKAMHRSFMRGAIAKVKDASFVVV